MSVGRRQTSAGLTKEYHYRFAQGGKLYTGVCEGCTTQAAAQAYEKRFRATTKRASEQKSVAALVENFRDALTGGQRIALAEAFDRAETKPRDGRQPSATSTAARRKWWGDFLAFMGERFPAAANVADVTPAMADEYIAEIRSWPQSTKTSNERQAAAKAVFEALRADAGLLQNPFAGRKPLPNRPARREAFTETELAAIFAAADDFTRPLFAIGIGTGLREGDICRLRWAGIDFRRGAIEVETSKTGAAVEIPMLPGVRACLEDLRRKAAPGAEYVMPEAAAMYEANRCGVVLRIHKTLAAAGIKTSRQLKGRTRAASVKDFHSLRHSFAYLAGLHGVPLVVVQSILGHMSPELTKLYSKHADFEAKRAAMAALPAFMGGGRPLLPAASDALAGLRRRIAEAVASATEAELRAIAKVIGEGNP